MKIEKALLIQFLTDVDAMLIHGIDEIQEENPNVDLQHIQNAQIKVEELYELLTEK